MLRAARGFGLTLAVLAIVTVPVAAQDTVAGTWTLTLNTPEGVMDMKLELTHEGSEIQGKADFAMAEATEISDVMYEDGIVSFLMHVGFQGQWLTVEMEAEVDGDEMVGEAYVPEMGEGASFTGKRAAG